jgi:hypothetical protein
MLPLAACVMRALTVRRISGSIDRVTGDVEGPHPNDARHDPPLRAEMQASTTDVLRAPERTRWVKAPLGSARGQQLRAGTNKRLAENNKSARRAER